MSIEVKEESASAHIARNYAYSGRPIAEVLTNGVFTVDATWTVRRWNQGAEKIFSIPAQRMIGKNIWEELRDIIPTTFYDNFHLLSIDLFPLNFKEYWGQKGSWFEGFSYCADGFLTVSFKNEPKIPSEVPPELPAQQLQTLNELYRYITHLTNDCLWEWDLVGEMIFWIDGGHNRVLGYPIENASVPQKFWESLLHPDDREKILLSLARVFSDTKPAEWLQNYRLKSMDGSYIHFHERGHIIYEEGQPVRIIGASQDVTNKVDMERQLDESEQKLALITRQMVSAVMITDNEQNIIWANEAFSRITGYTEKEVMGKQAFNYLREEVQGTDAVSEVSRQLNGDSYFDKEMEALHKDGQTYWIRLQSQPLFGNKGLQEGRFFVGTDITEKVRLEKRLDRERNERQREITSAVLTAQEKERCELGAELHDNVNQILSVTRLYVQMAKTHPEQLDKYLDKANGFIGEVIEELRRIAKTLVTPGLNEIGLFDSIKGLLIDLELDTIKFELEIFELSECEINEKLQLAIFRIIQEQINNMLKHSNATTANIVLTKVAGEIRLIIMDNGKGCNPAELRKGVGLLNIKSRAEVYGGSMDIFTGVDDGFTLNVFLPIEMITVQA